MCRTVDSPFKVRLAAMERSLPLLQCFTKQRSEPRREGKEEKGCEAERVEDENRRRSRRRSRKRRSRLIPFKLIPRPAGLHPVTLSCSPSPSAIPIQGAHLRRSAFPPPSRFPSLRVGIFIPGYFTALPWPSLSHSLIFHTVTTIQLL